MSKEAIKLALEALEEIALAGMSGTGQESDEAMTAWHARQAWKFIRIAATALTPIKEALAQSQSDVKQEQGVLYQPAAQEAVDILKTLGYVYQITPNGLAWVEQQEQGEPKCKTHPDAPHGFVRNASHSEDRYVCECEFWEPPEQDEPVAYINVEQRKLEWAKYTSWETPTVVNLPKIPLYTQTKKWVGLTNEEIEDCFDESCHLKVVDPKGGIKGSVNIFEVGRAIEAKLKEKNT